MKMEDVLLEEENDLSFELPTFSKPKASKTYSNMSTSSVDSGVGLSLKSSRSNVSSLIGDVDTSGCILPEVAWEVGRADLVIKVEKCLFPVHRSLISLYSDVLKNIIFSVNFCDEDTPVVTLMEQNPSSIMELLTHIYFQDKEVTDGNVFEILKVADVFVVERLIRKCEVFLMDKSKKAPLELLKVGCKYRLKNLVDLALVRVSRLPRSLHQIEKEDLGLEIENRILRLMVERYETSKKKCCVHVDGAPDCCYVKTFANAVKFHTASDIDDSSDDDSDSDLDYETTDDY